MVGKNNNEDVESVRESGESRKAKTRESYQMYKKNKY